MTTITPPRGPARSGAAPVPSAPTPGRPPAAPAPPTEAVPALLGALAVLGGTLAIPPMVSGGEWFWYTAEVVAVIWLVGVGARLARAPAAVVVFLQLAAAAIAMTALFTVRGYGGVIPNGAVLTEAGDLLSGAWTQIRSTVSPAPSSTELSFLICLSVSVTALGPMLYVALTLRAFRPEAQMPVRPTVTMMVLIVAWVALHGWRERAAL